MRVKANRIIIQLLFIAFAIVTLIFALPFSHTEAYADELTEVVIAASGSHVYGEAVSDVTLEIFGLDETQEETLRNVITPVVHGVTSLSPAGQTFTIDIMFADYEGVVFCSDGSYEYDGMHIIVDGHYEVYYATIFGWRLPAKTVTYDDTNYSLAVAPDEVFTEDISVSYRNNLHKEAGVYEVTAVLSKANYENLTLTSFLTIKRISAVTSVDNGYAELFNAQSSEGFSPDFNFVLEDIYDGALKNKVTKKYEGQRIDLKFYGTYRILLEEGGETLEIPDGQYRVALMLNEVSLNGIKIYTLIDGELVNKAYTVENGCLVFDADALEFIVVSDLSKKVYKNLTLFQAALILGGVLVALWVLLQGGKKWRRKEKARKKNSRKLHNKYV